MTEILNLRSFCALSRSTSSIEAARTSLASASVIPAAFAYGFTNFSWGGVKTLFSFFAQLFSLLRFLLLFLQRFYIISVKPFAKIEQISVLNKFFTEFFAVILIVIFNMTENQTIKERLLLYIKHLGIGQGKFESMCKLANGYVNNIRKSISPEKLQQIALYNPDLNTGWLMTGEGCMLKSNSQTIGDISNSNVSGVNVSGTDIHINPNAYDALLKVVEHNQKTTEKFQEQIDRLIAIIEKKYASESR